MKERIKEILEAVAFAQLKENFTDAELDDFLTVYADEIIALHDGPTRKIQRDIIERKVIDLLLNEKGFSIHNAGWWITSRDRITGYRDQAERDFNRLVDFILECSLK